LKDLKVYHKETVFHIYVHLCCFCICRWSSNDRFDSSKYI